MSYEEEDTCNDIHTYTASSYGMYPPPHDALAQHVTLAMLGTGRREKKFFFLFMKWLHGKKEKKALLLYYSCLAQAGREHVHDMRRVGTLIPRNT